mmetsp:Transcript_5289/g.8181  ORF Transcript_5289/g.8181 Transcript_5289/m.8181 type:complete len:101 (+) Transcript_5289:981-1283(+)
MENDDDSCESQSQRFHMKYNLDDYLPNIALSEASKQTIYKKMYDLFIDQMLKMEDISEQDESPLMVIKVGGKGGPCFDYMASLSFKNSVDEMYYIKYFKF